MTALADTPARTWGRGRRCGRQLTGFMTLVAGVWFVPIVVAIFFGFGIVQATVGGFEDGGQWTSGWENSLQPMRYFPLAMAILFGAGMMPNYVAHGVTRREFSIGMTLMIAASSVALAVVGAAGLVLEDVIFGWLGHSPVYTVPHLYTNANDVLLVFTEYALLTSIHMATGWLIGATYYRFGGLIGTALLPLTIVPILAAELVLSVSYFAEMTATWFGWDRQPLAVVIPACTAITATTMYATYRFVRHLAIKP